MVGVALAIITLWFYDRDKRQNANSGLLEPYDQQAGLYLSVGGSRFVLAPSTKGVFLTDQGEPILTIGGIGGKMLVSTKIRNEKGDLIAELHDNEWTHQSRPGIFDRNYTEHALEIRDTRGRVALQVVDFGRTVHVAAIFRCKNGWTVVMGPWTNGGAAFDLRPPYMESRLEISPICEYPSDNHFGQCPGADKLKAVALPEGQAMLLAAPVDICPAHKGSESK
jgi:hypothetical protein